MSHLLRGVTLAITLIVASAVPTAAAVNLSPPAPSVQESRVLRLQPGFWAVPLPAGVSAIAWPQKLPDGWAFALAQGGQPAMLIGADGQTLIFVRVPERGDDLLLPATIAGKAGTLSLMIDLIGFPAPPCKCLPHRP